MPVADAVAASGIADATRVRLIQRSDGPVYVVSGASGVRAVHGSDGADASVEFPDVALAIGQDHARRRGLDATHAAIFARADYDQWTVPNGFDRHRPLFRVALGDAAGTEVYVSSRTGEVVLDTTRSERGWNWVGSVLHWIYPTVLRSNWALWDRVVWYLSLLALIAALLGAVLGIVRIRRRGGLIGSPYRGWHALHHIIGLVSTVFVLTWIFSGWLSMDHGRLFSRGQLTPAGSRHQPIVYQTGGRSHWPIECHQRLGKSNGLPSTAISTSASGWVSTSKFWQDQMAKSRVV